MGHCNHCGAPCPECVRRSDFTLLRLPEPIRSKVKRLLDDVECRTNKRSNEFISELMQYSLPMIERTFRVWNKGNYAYQEKDERYFLGILKHNATGVKQQLDSLPPIAKYKEEYSEQEDGDEVSSGLGVEPKTQQELQAPTGSTEEGRRQSSAGSRLSSTRDDGARKPNDTGGTGPQT